MTLLLQKREEFIPADTVRGSSAKGKKERLDRHEETKDDRGILVRGAVADSRAPKALNETTVEDL